MGSAAIELHASTTRRLPMQRFPLPSLSITGLVLAIGLGTSASHSVANPLFGAAFYSSATGTGPFIAPYCVAVGDLNGDGMPDVAIANYEATSVSIMLGNGDGTLGPKTDYNTAGSGVGTGTVG